MKKKSFLIVLLVLLVSMCAFACGSPAPFNEYAGFDGTNEYSQMTVDSNMTLDGKLDEDVWKNSANTLSVTSKYSTEEKPLKMEVSTYLGENGVYFAFNVSDNALFYNPGRKQSRNTGVELYMSTLDHFDLGAGCVSIRLTPTGNPDDSAVVNYYRPNGTKTEWTSAKARGKYLGAAVVDGEMNSDAKNSKGYTAEIAVSWELLGVEKADAVHFTAAFVQAINYDADDRRDNTFLAGTTHTRPGTWKAVNNAGIIEDQYAYLDETAAVPDEGMTIDGKLDEAGWQSVIADGKGKSFTQTSSGISLSIYTMMTDKGIYVGLDSNDNDVYYSADRAVKYNTGAELFIAAKGVTKLTENNVVQIRFNVGGSGERYYANPDSDYPYKSAYFPAKIKGSVKNGEINTSDADGWIGEVFVPWSSLGVTKAEDKNQAAVLTSIYHNETDSADDVSMWKYIAITGGDVFGNGSAETNPQQTWFNFTREGGFRFNGVSIPTVAFGKGNANADGDFEITLTPQYADAIALSGFETDKPPVIGGTFEAVDGVEFTDNEDGTYTMTVDKDKANYFSSPRSIGFTSAEGIAASFEVSYDADFSLDGILDDGVYAGLNHAVLSAASGSGAAVSDFVFSLHDKAMYVGVDITDANVSAVSNGSGVEIYFNFGDTLSSANTYQVRLYADGTVKYYVYSDTPTNEDGFSWKENSSLAPQVYLAVRTTGTGYVLEAKIPWSLFNLEEAPADCDIAMLTKFRTNTSGNPTYSVLMDKNNLGNLGSRDIANYLAFDETGFAPSAIYASGELNFVRDVNVVNGNYVGSVVVSYLPAGAMRATGVVFGEYDDYAIDNGDGSYTLEIPRAVVEAIDGSATITITKGGASGSLKVNFIDASADDFNGENVVSYINFDDGLVDLVGGKTVSVTRGEAVYEEHNGSYGSDKAYVANMKHRETKLAATVGTDSFTVSMMINGDQLNNYPGNTYAFILFGTGNVDGSDGFSVRFRAGDKKMQVKLGDKANDVGTDAIFAKVGGWQRWTFSFDRSVTDKITVTFWLDGEQMFARTFDYASDKSLDVPAYNTIGIGSPGSVADTSSYPGVTDVNVGIDGFMLYDGVMTVNDVYNLLQYVKELDAKYAFGTDDITFDFSDVDAADGYTHQIYVTGYTADGTVNLTDVTFGDEIAKYITRGQSDEYFTFHVSAEEAKLFKNGVTSTYTYGGVTKQITITYYGLDRLYLDTDALVFYTGDKAGANYVFTVGVYADENNTVPVVGATFTSSLGNPVDNGDGTYTFTVSEDVIEGLKAPVTVEVEFGAAEPASFSVEYAYLSEDEITAIAAATDAYLDFDNGFKESINGKDASMRRGEAVFADKADSYSGDKYYVTNQRKYAAKLDASVGTDSFTVSMMVNGDDILSAITGNAGYPVVLFGTGSVDGAVDNAQGFSVRIRHDESGTKPDAFQIKAMGARDDSGTDAVFAALDGWQRWTVVFDRAQADITVRVYIDEKLVHTATLAVAADVSLDGAEGAVFGIGAPGFDDMLNGAAYPDVSVGIDEFMLIGKALSEKEVILLSGVRDEILARAAWSIGNVSFSFADVTEGEDYTAQLKLNGASDLTGITFSGLVGGAAVTEAEGVYTLSIPYEAIGQYSGGVTVTATVGSIVKQFTVTYTALEAVYVDKTEINFVKKDKVGDDYVFTVGVYADSAHSVPLKNATFVSGALGNPVNNGDGTYTFTVSAEIIEGLDAPVTVEVEFETAEPASFTVGYTALSDAEIAEIAAATEIFADFNGNTNDVVNAHASSMRRGERIYEDNKYYVANMKQRALKFDNVTLGTDSFTVSAVINGDDVKSYPGNTYAFILFGTGSVDGTEGFSVRVRGDNTMQVRVGGTTNHIGSADIFAKIGGWQRWTYTFDRSVADKLTFSFWLDDEKLLTKTVDVKSDYSFDVAGYNSLGVGASGSADDVNGNYPAVTDVNIRYDNFMLQRGVLTDDQIKLLDSHYDDVLAKNAWVFGDVAITYADVTEGQPYVTQLEIGKLSENVSVAGASFDGLPDGAEIKETDGAYTLTVPYDVIEQFAQPKTVTVTLNGVTKDFEISYTALTAIYLSDDEITLYTTDKSEESYEFTVGVYADNASSVPVTGVTFGEWNDYATDNGDGTYEFTVPATVMEAAASHAVTATKTASTALTAQFTVNYIDWSFDAIAADTEAYFSFDGDVHDYAAAHTAAPAKGSAAKFSAKEGSYVGDKALDVNCATDTLAINELTFGTESFTLSFDVKINSADFAGSNASYVLIDSMLGNDGEPCTVQLSAHGGRNAFRLQLGRNDHDFYFAAGKVKTDAWQNVTLVVQRNAGYDAEHTTTAMRYNEDGSYNGDASITNTYSTPEKVLITLYLDGVKAQEKEFWFSEGQSLGTGTVYLGGNSSSSNKNSSIDNFVLYRGAVNERQLDGFFGYVETMQDKTAFALDDVTFDFMSVTEAGYTHELIVKDLNPTETVVTEGVTFGDEIKDYVVSAGGGYTLTIPADKLNDFSGGVYVSYTYNGITKTFLIEYVGLTTLYIDDIKLYEAQIDADGYVTQSVRVTADEAGTVGLDNVDFGELSGYVTAGSAAGDYIIKMPEAAAREYAAAKEITVTYEDITAQVSVVFVEPYINDAYSGYIDTVSNKNNNVQGGKVYQGIELGTDSFTVAFNADNLDKIASGGGGYILFSTGNTDVSKGINVYANSTMFRFRMAGVSGNFPINHNLAQYTDWTHLMFTFDRSVAKEITITVYVNYAKVGSVTKTLTADESLSYGSSKNLVMGSINGEMWAESGAMPSTNQYWLGVSGLVVTGSVVSPENMRAYFDKFDAQYSAAQVDLKGDFDFADGTASNSVAESEVTMAVADGAEMNVVEGREGGEDKAVKVNPLNNFYEVSGFDISTGSFTVSVWTKMDFTTALTENGSNIALFGTTNPDATAGFCVSIRKNYIRVRANGGTYGFTVSELDSLADTWTNITVTLERNNGKAQVVVYVNYKFAGCVNFALADDVSLGAGDGLNFRVGSSNVGSTATGEWPQSMYADNTFTMDDIVLANEALTPAEVFTYLDAHFGA